MSADAHDIRSFETSEAYDVAVGADGSRAVFTTGWGIGRIDPSGVMAAPLEKHRSPPGRLQTAPMGTTGFTDGGPRIRRVTAEGQVTSFTLPNALSVSGDITSGPDGRLWFTEQGTDRIGRMTTSGGLEEFDLPSARVGLAGITAGPDGNLWFAEATANRIGESRQLGRLRSSTCLRRTAAHIRSLPDRMATSGSRCRGDFGSAASLLTAASSSFRSRHRSERDRRRGWKSVAPRLRPAHAHDSSRHRDLLRHPADLFSAGASPPLPTVRSGTRPATAGEAAPSSVLLSRRPPAWRTCTPSA